MRKLLVLSIAVTGFSLPSLASADIFTHEGQPVESTTEVELEGPVGFTINGTSQGVHCPKATIRFDLFPSGTITITRYRKHSCTITPSNLPADLIPKLAEGGDENHLGWHGHLLTGGIIEITSMHMTSQVTLGGTVVAESTLEGDVTLAVNNTETISTATLAGDGVTANGNAASLSGDLQLVNPSTDIGIE